LSQYLHEGIVESLAVSLQVGDWNLEPCKYEAEVLMTWLPHLM